MSYITCGVESDLIYVANRIDISTLCKDIDEEEDGKIEIPEKNNEEKNSDGNMCSIYACEILEIPPVLEETETPKEDCFEKNLSGSYLDDDVSTIISTCEEEVSAERKKESNFEPVHIITIRGGQETTHFERILSSANINDHNVEKKLNDMFYDLCCRSIGTINVRILQKARHKKKNEKHDPLKIKHIDYGDIFLTIFNPARKTKNYNGNTQTHCALGMFTSSDERFQRKNLRNLKEIPLLYAPNYVPSYAADYAPNYATNNVVTSKDTRQWYNNHNNNNTNNRVYNRSTFRENDLRKRQFAQYSRNPSQLEEKCFDFDSKVIGYDELNLRNRTFLKKVRFAERRNEVHYYPCNDDIASSVEEERELEYKKNAEHVMKYIPEEIPNQTRKPMRSFDVDTYEDFQEVQSKVEVAESITEKSKLLYKHDPRLHEDLQTRMVRENVSTYSKGTETETETETDNNNNIYVEQERIASPREYKRLSDVKEMMNVEGEQYENEFTSCKTTIIEKENNTSKNKTDDMFYGHLWCNNYGSDDEEEEEEEEEVSNSKEPMEPKPKNTIVDEVGEIGNETGIDTKENKKEKSSPSKHGTENKMIHCEQENKQLEKEQVEKDEEHMFVVPNDTYSNMSISGCYGSNVCSDADRRCNSSLIEDESYFDKLLKDYEHTKITKCFEDDIAPILDEIEQYEALKKNTLSKRVTYEIEKENETKDRSEGKEENVTEDRTEKRMENWIYDSDFLEEKIQANTSNDAEILTNAEVEKETMITSNANDLREMVVTDLFYSCISHSKENFEEKKDNNEIIGDNTKHLQTAENETDECNKKDETTEEGIPISHNADISMPQDSDVPIPQNKDAPNPSDKEHSTFLEKLKEEVKKTLELHFFEGDYSAVEEEVDGNINENEEEKKTETEGKDKKLFAEKEEYNFNDDNFVNDNTAATAGPENFEGDNFMYNDFGNDIFSNSENDCNGKGLRISDLNDVHMESNKNDNYTAYDINVTPNQRGNNSNMKGSELEHNNFFFHSSMRMSEKKNMECQTDFPLSTSRNLSRSTRKRNVEVKLIHKKLTDENKMEKGTTESTRRYPKRNRHAPLRHWIGEREITRRNPVTGEIEVVGISKCKNEAELSPYLTGPVSYTKAFMKEAIKNSLMEEEEEEEAEAEAENLNYNYQQEEREEDAEQEESNEENEKNEENVNPYLNSDINENSYSDYSHTESRGTSEQEKNEVSRKMNSSNNTAEKFEHRRGRPIGSTKIKRRRRRKKFITLNTFIQKQRKKRLKRIVESSSDDNKYSHKSDDKERDNNDIFSRNVSAGGGQEYLLSERISTKDDIYMEKDNIEAESRKMFEENFCLNEYIPMTYNLERGQPSIDSLELQLGEWNLLEHEAQIFNTSDHCFEKQGNDVNDDDYMKRKHLMENEICEEKGNERFFSSEVALNSKNTENNETKNAADMKNRMKNDVISNRGKDNEDISVSAFTQTDAIQETPLNVNDSKHIRSDIKLEKTEYDHTNKDLVSANEKEVHKEEMNGEFPQKKTMYTNSIDVVHGKRKRDVTQTVKLLNSSDEEGLLIKELKGNDTNDLPIEKRKRQQKKRKISVLYENLALGKLSVKAKKSRKEKKVENMSKRMMKEEWKKNLETKTEENTSKLELVNRKNNEESAFEAMEEKEMVRHKNDISEQEVEEKNEPKLRINNYHNFSWLNENSMNDETTATANELKNAPIIKCVEHNNTDEVGTKEVGANDIGENEVDANDIGKNDVNATAEPSHIYRGKNEPQEDVLIAEGIKNKNKGVKDDGTIENKEDNIICNSKGISEQNSSKELRPPSKSDDFKMIKNVSINEMCEQSTLENNTFETKHTKEDIEKKMSTENANNSKIILYNIDSNNKGYDRNNMEKEQMNSHDSTRFEVENLPSILNKTDEVEPAVPVSVAVESSDSLVAKRTSIDRGDKTGRGGIKDDYKKKGGSKQEIDDVNKNRKVLDTELEALEQKEINVSKSIRDDDDKPQKKVSAFKLIKKKTLIPGIVRQKILSSKRKGTTNSNTRGIIKTVLERGVSLFKGYNIFKKPISLDLEKVASLLYKKDISSLKRCHDNNSGNSFCLPTIKPSENPRGADKIHRRHFFLSKELLLQQCALKTPKLPQKIYGIHVAKKEHVFLNSYRDNLFIYIHVGERIYVTCRNTGKVFTKRDIFSIPPFSNVQIFNGGFADSSLYVSSVCIS